MKKLSKICDKIYYYNNLDVDKKRQMIEHIALCSDCKVVFKKLLLAENQSSGDHLDPSLLDRYVVYKHYLHENLSNEEGLSNLEIQRIEKHFKVCSACRSSYQGKQLVYKEMDTFWKNADLPDFELNPSSKLKPQLSILEKFSMRFKEFIIPRIPLYKPVAFIVAIIVLFFVLTQIINVEKPTLDELALLNEIYIPYSIRSATNGLQNGIIAFNQKDFNRAILKFEDYIKYSKTPDNINYVRYLLGLSYVMRFAATKEKSSNENKLLFLSKGIANLELALIDTENRLLRENILWYLAKAQLMNKDIVQATEYFKKVKLINGLKAKASHEILQSLKSYKNN